MFLGTMFQNLEKHFLNMDVSVAVCKNIQYGDFNDNIQRNGKLCSSQLNDIALNN